MPAPKPRCRLWSRSSKNVSGVRESPPDRGWPRRSYRDRFTLTDLLSVDFDVAGDPARQHLHWAIVAQGFLDCGFDQRTIVAKPAPCFGAIDEDVEHVAHQIGGGFVARDQQQDTESEDLPLFEMLALHLGLDHAR